MGEIKKIAERLVLFRKEMGLGVDINTARYIWGKKEVKLLEKEGLTFLKKRETNLYVDEKFQLARDSVKDFLIFNWVKFVAVSGSVAAGFAKEEDDIDIFIVVKDGCAWFYRGLIKIRGLFKGRFRAKIHGQDVKNLFCLNLICEEKGLLFENDIFEFNELMYVKPIYQEEYLAHIYSINPWLKKDFMIKKELLISRLKKSKDINILVKGINYFAFLAQVIFMYLTGHSPEIDRLKSNFKKGRIEFFPGDFKERFI